MKASCVIVVSLLPAPDAVAQGLRRDDAEILVSLNVGYNTAYRDNSWVQVDVIVTNEQRDLTGWVEVRTYGPGGELQSPIYRVPAECPQGSKKRFRLHCYLSQSSKIEAWVYEGERTAVDVPAYMLPIPIDDGDLLGLVLDDDPMMFEFLPRFVQPEQGAIRFFRHNMGTAVPALLPDYAESYEVIDVIVIGKIDPTRVSKKHRELIEQFVRDGGTLVVCTGVNAGLYRGSWLEPLLGVEVGASEAGNEWELAPEIFPGEPARAVSVERQVDFVELRPSDRNVKTFGVTRTLATANPLGEGWVCTLAADVESGAFRSLEYYGDLLRQVVTLRSRDARNLSTWAVENVSDYFLNKSGLELRSREFVAAFLGIYLLVGLVGNWLF